MTKLPKSFTLQTTVFTHRRLRWIVLWVLISLVVLLGIGVTIALLWPHRWSPLLVSLVLNIISSLIGAAVAILTAIFVIQKYLDDRNQHEEIRKARYHAKWTIVQYQHIKVVTYNITHICLFVVFGKDRYSQITDCTTCDIPASIHDFIPTFTCRLMEEMEKPTKAEIDKEQLSQQDKQHWFRWKQAFRDKADARVLCDTSDVDSLLHILRGYQVNVKNLLYLIQPFMPDKMGMAYALVDLSYELDLTIDTIKRHIAAEIANNPPDHLYLCEAIISRIVSLGNQAVKVKEMISANQEDDLYAVSDQFPLQY